MSNKSKPNNDVNEAGASSEGFSPGRCPIGEQDELSLHQTNADRYQGEQSSNAMLIQK